MGASIDAVKALHKAGPSSRVDRVTLDIAFQRVTGLKFVAPMWNQNRRVWEKVCAAKRNEAWVLMGRVDGATWHVVLAEFGEKQMKRIKIEQL